MAVVIIKVGNKCAATEKKLKVTVAVKHGSNLMALYANGLHHHHHVMCDIQICHENF
jgi:hypothetical protein